MENKDLIDNEIFINNIQAIDEEIKDGFEKLNKTYKLREVDCGHYSSIKIQNISYNIKQYEIIGVGNLLVMESKNSVALQMLSFVITPFYKNLPLLSSDYIFMKDKRSFLVEYYDLVKEKDLQYLEYIDKLKAIKDKYSALTDMKLKECWYNSLKTVCIAKKTNINQDNEMFSVFNENLQAFIKKEQETEALSKSDRQIKWQITQDYIDKLIDVDGVSTNVFKNSIGVEATREFFHNVFFGTGKFKI